MVEQMGPFLIQQVSPQVREREGRTEGEGERGREGGRD
jgi:hypothetical protein